MVYCIKMLVGMHYGRYSRTLCSVETQGIHSQQYPRGFLYSSILEDSFIVVPQGIHSQQYPREFLHSSTLGNSFIVVPQGIPSQQYLREFLHSSTLGNSFIVVPQGIPSQQYLREFIETTVYCQTYRSTRTQQLDSESTSLLFLPCATQLPEKQKIPIL